MTGLLACHATGKAWLHKLVKRSQGPFTHTAMHTLNLAVSDTVRQCTVIGKALDIVYEITKLIKSLHIDKQHWRN